MASVSKAIAARIIQSDGIYPGDEDMLVVRVVKYKRTLSGAEQYGIVYESEAKRDPEMLFRYDEITDYIHDPVVVWRHKDWRIQGHAVIAEEEALDVFTPLANDPELLGSRRLMSKSFHLAIDGNDNAMKFLSAVQDTKSVTVSFKNNGVWVEETLPVMFIAMIDNKEEDNATDGSHPATKGRKRNAGNK